MTKREIRAIWTQFLIYRQNSAQIHRMLGHTEPDVDHQISRCMDCQKYNLPMPFEDTPA